MYSGQQPSNVEEGLDDLQFMTSVEDSIQQNVPVPPVKSLDDHTGGSYGMVGTTDRGTGSVPANGILSDSAHPIACIFHIIFKACGIFLYIFAKFFTGKSEVTGANFIVVSVFCILFLAADFWVVKNITGRLLVGLRWWNQVDPNGQSRWIFESSQTPNKNKFDNTIFWFILYFTPFLWMTLFFTAFITFQFQWLVVVIIGLSFAGSNLYGYYKCSSDQRQKVQQLMVRGAEMGAVSMIKNNVFGRLSNFAKSMAGSNDQNVQTQQNNNATFS